MIIRPTLTYPSCFIPHQLTQKLKSIYGDNDFFRGQQIIANYVLILWA